MEIDKIISQFSNDKMGERGLLPEEKTIIKDFYNWFRPIDRVQEISDDFDDEFRRLINDQKLLYKIINWWYESLKRERKYFEKLITNKQKIKTIVDDAIGSTHTVGADTRKHIVDRVDDIIELGLDEAIKKWQRDK